MRRIPLLLLLAGLVACQSTPGPTNAQAEPMPEATVAPVVADAQLQGQVLPPPDYVLPAGARLQLHLIDRFSPEPDALPLALSETPLQGAPPFRFQLPFARESVRDVTVYRLDVAVFDAAGRLLLISDGEHPVNLGVEAEPTRIELIAVGGALPAQRFDCGGFVAEAQVHDPDLRLQLGDGVHALRRAQSANGVRYVGADAEFWSQGSEARIQLGGERWNCIRLD